MTNSTTHTLQISGTRLLLDGAPFHLQGLSFFNALYNSIFNRSPEDRLEWLGKFKENGVNTLRVWCQWDYQRPYVDLSPMNTLFSPKGDLRDIPMKRLVELITDMDRLEMVIELVLFCQEKDPNLPLPALERAVVSTTRAVKPYRNLILQIWNEKSDEVYRLYELAKAEDPERIVTNSPGVANVLGDEKQNQMLDILTPHTVRGEAPEFWKIAPQQIADLIKKYQKPVIDDEPARCGLVNYGGIPGGTEPWQHIEQIKQVRAVGGYHIYHHDMFQNPYGDPATPTHGLPNPDFSPFHRQVFDYLRDNPTW